MPGFTFAGEPINTAIIELFAGDTFTVLVEHFNMGQHLIGAIGGVGICLVIANALFQHVFHIALVAQVLKQCAVFNNIFRRALIGLWPFPLNPELFGLLNRAIP